jgi:hypothetical protein
MVKDRILSFESMRSCRATRLTYEISLWKISYPLSSGSFTYIQRMGWAQNETRRRSQVLCTIRDYKRNPVDSWNNSASPLLYTKCFQTLTPLTTYDLSPAHLLMASPDIAGEDSVQVRLVPANQSIRLPKHFLRRQCAPRGRLTNHQYRLLCISPFQMSFSIA